MSFSSLDFCPVTVMSAWLVQVRKILAQIRSGTRDWFRGTLVCWSRSSGKGGECYWELWRRDSSRQTPGKKGAPECPAREQEEREEDHPFQGQPLTPGTIEWNEKKWKKTRRGKNFWQYHCFTQTKTLSHAHTPIQTQTHAHTHTHTHAPHI